MPPALQLSPSSAQNANSLAGLNMAQLNQLSQFNQLGNTGQANNPGQAGIRQELLEQQARPLQPLKTLARPSELNDRTFWAV